MKILLAIVILILIGGGYFIYQQSDQPTPAPTTTQSDNKTNPDTTSNPDQTGVAADTATPEGTTPDPTPRTGRFSDETDIMAPDLMVHEVQYNGSAFSPASLTVKKGDVVIFKNTSTQTVWPASDPHPSHVGYPGFDAETSLSQGQTFSFKFEQVGEWGYHNHFSPSQRGTIVVEQ